MSLAVKGRADLAVVPAAKAQKGYLAIYLLVDCKTGKGLSISAWDSEENAVANEQNGYYQEQIGKFKELLAAPPVQEGYELVVQG